MLKIVEFIKYLKYLSENFMPHSMCFLDSYLIIVFHVISNIMIAAAYFTIPCMLFYIVKKSPNLKKYNKIFLLFAAFIFWCGLTHVFDIIVIWHPVYIIQGFVNFITGLISLFTSFLLFKNISSILSITNINEYIKELKNKAKEEFLIEIVEERLEKDNV